MQLRQFQPGDKIDYGIKKKSKGRHPDEILRVRPYCLDVLVLQRELSVLGSDLVPLLVHHFLQLLHHLPLPLRHTCRGKRSGTWQRLPLRSLFVKGGKKGQRADLRGGNSSFCVRARARLFAGALVPLSPVCLRASRRDCGLCVDRRERL